MVFMFTHNVETFSAIFISKLELKMSKSFGMMQILAKKNIIDICEAFFHIFCSQHTKKFTSQKYVFYKKVSTKKATNFTKFLSNAILVFGSKTSISHSVVENARYDSDMSGHVNTEPSTKNSLNFSYQFLPVKFKNNFSFICHVSLLFVVNSCNLHNFVRQLL